MRTRHGVIGGVVGSARGAGTRAAAAPERFQVRVERRAPAIGPECSVIRASG